MNTPGDYIGIGLLVAVAGAAVVGLAAAVTETAELLWLATIPSVIGGVIMQIGVIAWGVAVGVRTATTGRSVR